MKKVSILLLLLACSVLAFSQAFVKSEEKQILKKADKGFVKHEKTISSERNNSKATILYEEDFDGSIADWDFGHLDNARNIGWTVGDATQAYQSGGFNYYYSSANSLGQNVFKSEKAAYIDAVSADPFFGGTGADLSKAYIVIDNIPLSSAIGPKLVFDQTFRKLNDVASYVEWKSDIATEWTRLQINTSSVNDNVYQNTVEVLLTGAAGVDNLSIRWLWDNEELTPIPGTTGEFYPLGYYWVIDNIQIVESEQYDLSLEDFRVGSFFARDYHDPEAIGILEGGFTYNKYFHYSSFYGTYAKDVDQGEYNMLIFHGIVNNMGAATVTPGIKVDIYPEGEEDNIIWTKTKYKTTTLAPGATDTIDIWYLDEDGENYFDLNLCEIGSYVVKFEAVMQEGDDEVPSNSIKYSNFRMTQNIFSRDYAEIPDGYIDMSSSSAGGSDGDKFGVNFMFFTPTDIAGIDYFLGRTTEVGSAVEFSVMRWSYDADNWVTETSQRVNIESAEMADKWHSLDFDIPIQLPIVDNYITEVMLVATFYYGDNKKISIGNDVANNASYHSVSWNYVSGNGWTNYVGERDNSPSLRFRTTSGPESVVCPNDITIAMDTIAQSNSNICFSGATPEGGIYEGEHVSNNCMNVFNLPKGEYPITYRHDNGSCTFKVKLNPTYVPSLEDLGVNIYPNPTNGDLRIDNIKGATVEILNTMGQVINKIENANEFNTVDISEFANGTYFVKIILDGKVGVERINLMK
ncbi:MAG: T9SS type A sorting domain-containing protein [Bacteroidales bacterium]|jgi:hypothetical protein|nr:T9SS type A sorting domain-containing protein [Bacteroidales bacterium]